MRQAMRRIAAATAVVVLTALAITPSVAQQDAWPNRQVTMVIPFLAGGSADIIGRAVAEHLSAALGQTVVVENRGGAAGNVGAAIVAKAPADGYTLLLATTGPAATATLMYKKLSFDARRDFTPIVLIGKTPVIIVTKPDGPIKDMKGLIAYAKANPGKLTAGFPGNGAVAHITAVLLKQQAGVDMKEVQYRGGTGVLNDTLGGHIDIGMDAMTPYVPQVQDGTLRALAITGATRWSLLPNVPTVSESGLPGFEASVWYCLLAPTGIPGEVVAKLNAATNDYLKTAKARELFEKIGVLASGGTPADLKTFIDQEIDKWGPVVRDAKMEF
jgi:tripartite-type tricarboxylate transporter receptor subunit TctC